MLFVVAVMFTKTYDTGWGGAGKGANRLPLSDFPFVFYKIVTFTISLLPFPIWKNSSAFTVMFAPLWKNPASAPVGLRLLVLVFSVTGENSLFSLT